jgi:hypothetical protein
MRHSEYERRRRALEEQFRADVALIRAGYEAKLRALEMFWLASAEEAPRVLPAARPPLLTSGTPTASATPAMSEPVPTSETLAASETLVSETLAVSETLVSETLAASETLPAEPPLATPPSQPVRRGQIFEEVDAVFPELPVVFDKRDVVAALGFAPPRATLYRVFSQLLSDRRVTMEHAAEGHAPTRYRKLAEPA